MKILAFNFVLLLFLASGNNVFTQESCKVLKVGIDSIYQGKCKNGLAHGKGKADGVDSYIGKFSKGLPNGKGTYTWANGNIYTGSWKEGLRDGEGTLTIKMDDNDSIVSGLWEDDKYKGPKPIKPKVVTNIGVDRYSFKRLSDSKDRVLVNILQNGMKNTTISNFLISSDSGAETTLGSIVGYEFIEFPVTIKVNYFTLNKTKTATYQVIFEFTISDPGDWRVEIHN